LCKPAAPVAVDGNGVSRDEVESAANGLALPPIDDKAESTVQGTRFGFVSVRFRILA